MSRILIVVGTRPNFIKITRFKKVNGAMGSPFDIRIVHTGQHYDDKMANVFFGQFGLEPDFFLNITASSVNTQMAEIMTGLEKTILDFKPSLIMVTGDVNSTFAAALTAHKMNIKLAHIESGLRSFDRTMPEELNRILTDEIADYFFVTEQSGVDNLIREGKNHERIFMVGNTMIDTLVAFENKIEKNPVLEKLKLAKNTYALMTMHRPATVDFEDGLKKLIEVIDHITSIMPLVFPIHPRTMKRMETYRLLSKITTNNNLHLTEPMDYFSFQKLIACSRFVITDSGGIQEETTFRRIPCLTLRANTERPSTVDVGTNELIPFDIKIIDNRIRAIGSSNFKKGEVPEKWDGKSTERILNICMEIFGLLAGRKESVI